MRSRSLLGWSGRGRCVFRCFFVLGGEGEWVLFGCEVVFFRYIAFKWVLGRSGGFEGLLEV